MLFMREKYVWTVTCICCTGLLFHEIFMDFFVAKPTITSVEETNLSEIDFPDVLVCVQNGFSRKMLKRYGYDDSFGYFVGQDEWGNFIGWNGLNNEDPFRHDSNNLKNSWGGGHLEGGCPVARGYFF